MLVFLWPYVERFQSGFLISLWVDAKQSVRIQGVLYLFFNNNIFDMFLCLLVVQVVTYLLLVRYVPPLK